MSYRKRPLIDEAREQLQKLSSLIRSARPTAVIFDLDQTVSSGCMSTVGGVCAQPSF